MPVVTAPRGVGDIDARWLTEALADVSDGARVTELAVVRVGLGNVADSVRLIPTWDRPTPGPASVVTKVPSSEEVTRATGFAMRTYELEAAFYSQLAGSVWVHRPECFCSVYEPAREGYAVVLEDLAPAEAGDQIAGCPPEDAAAVIPELVALHAPRWGDPELLDMVWLDRPNPDSARELSALIPVLFTRFADRYRSRVEPDVFRLCERLVERLEGYLLNRPGPWTVVHGDFRLDNVLFGGPRVAVVDWQTVKIGPGLSDVAYFIGSALSPDVRREHEAPLLEAYHVALGQAGVELPWDDCWTGYRRYAFDGLVMGIAASLLVAQTARSDDMFMAMVNRHGRQAIDLHSDEFLI